MLVLENSVTAGNTLLFITWKTSSFFMENYRKKVDCLDKANEL